MKVYLVGGAVRDQLLGLTVNEHDWVVVGADRETLLEQGYQQVGHDFPVFLHPETHEEYALARTERKTGHGYKGFDFNVNNNVSLEEDLERRDLTINAIAKNRDGELIDPFHGVEDIAARKLRHVSPAFSEDPLRVLRVARFLARFQSLGFSIADETLQFMQSVASSEELTHLTPERIWRETEKALNTQNPEAFFHCLYDCGALQKVMPEIASLYHQNSIEQPDKTLRDLLTLSMQLAVTHQLGSRLRFALASYLLGKPFQGNNIPCGKDEEYSAHTNKLSTLLDRIKSPNEYRELALMTSLLHRYIRHSLSLRPKTVIDLLQRVDAWRKPDRFNELLAVCNIIDKSTENHSAQQDESKSIQFLRQCHIRCVAIKAEKFIDQGITGSAIGEAILQARLITVAETKKSFG